MELRWRRLSRARRCRRSYYGVMVTGPFMDPKVQRRVRRLAARSSAARGDRVRERADPAPGPRRPHHLDGRLQHDLRSPVAREARADRPARAAAQRAAHPRQQLPELGLWTCSIPTGSVPRRSREWLASNGRPPPQARRRIDFRGLERLPSVSWETLSARRAGDRAAEREGAEPLPAETLRVGYVLKRYPRYSETFIVNEIRRTSGPASKSRFCPGPPGRRRRPRRPRRCALQLPTWSRPRSIRAPGPSAP